MRRRATESSNWDRLGNLPKRKFGKFSWLQKTWSSFSIQVETDFSSVEDAYSRGCVLARVHVCRLCTARE